MASRSLLLPLAVAAAVAVFVVTELAYQHSEHALLSLGQRAAARTAIATVIRRMLDAETAQRGYLITGRTEYLGPSDEAWAEVEQAFNKLARHYAEDPESTTVLRDMRDRAAERQSELAATIRLYDGGQHARWRDLVLTNIGREKMEAVRSHAETLLAREDKLVAAERSSIVSTLGVNRVAVHVFTALSLLALVLYLRKRAALERLNEHHAAALQTERDDLERQVLRRTAELTELAQHLQTAREDERSRLARELHDELGALLTAAKLDLARLRRAMPDPNEAQEQRLQHLIRIIDEGIALKRNIIETLRPSSLSNLGLVPALEIQAQEFAARSGLKVHTALQAVALPDDTQISVYRLVQEALTNIAKHAGATQVHITLRPAQDKVHITVRDDGKGFDPARTLRGSHGLTGMRYRVEAAGGVMKVHSAPGRGSEVQAWVPLGTQPEHETAP